MNIYKKFDRGALYKIYIDDIVVGLGYENKCDEFIVTLKESSEEDLQFLKDLFQDDDY